MHTLFMFQGGILCQQANIEKPRSTLQMKIILYEDKLKNDVIAFENILGSNYYRIPRQKLTSSRSCYCYRCYSLPKVKL